jgi:demethylmenaquinone methyltransferase/2-methoxy-6-polyprenyl-1,4-benzoquinol methylase
MNKAGPVRDMFDRIARRYDLVNTVMTGGIDAVWRRRAVAQLALRTPCPKIIDLCCGTGALTLEIARRVPGAAVVGADFSPAMLAVARARRSAANVEYVEADVLQLPFDAGQFAGATMGFSMRNVVDVGACLRETARILRPGARFVNLDVSEPQNRLWRQAFDAYFYGLVPLIGRLLGGDAAAYRYLPQSLVNFPDSRRLAQLFCDNGFEQVRAVPLFGGIATLHVGASQGFAAPAPGRHAGVSAQTPVPGAGERSSAKDYASSA